MKNALNEALDSCETLRQPAKEEAFESIKESMPSMPAELAKQTAERMRDAVDMGNVTDLKSIAKDLKSRSDAYSVFSEKIIRLAEDFDFEAILKLSADLASQQEA